MSKPARKIVLTGFMGAGKTTVAKALGFRFNCRVIDLDDFIAGREGRRVSAIIDEDSEEQFREIETHALRHALQDSSIGVIALGGGTWTFERNLTLISEHDCISVWLDAPFDLCWKRITNEANPRPLARDKGKSHQLYDQRQVCYALASLRVEVAKDSRIEDVVTKIITALSRQFGAR